jgi:hypothetical protein
MAIARIQLRTYLDSLSPSAESRSSLYKKSRNQLPNHAATYVAQRAWGTYIRFERWITAMYSAVICHMGFHVVVGLRRTHGRSGQEENESQGFEYCQQGRQETKLSVVKVGAIFTSSVERCGCAPSDALLKGPG